MRTLLSVLVVAVLTGCASYTKAMYGGGDALEDYSHCLPKGITNAGIDACMKAAGWDKYPDPQPQGPAAYHRP